MIWLVSGIVLCAVVVAVITLRRRFQSSSAGRKLVILAWSIAFLLLLTALVLSGNQNRRQRNELRNISASAITNVTITRQGSSRVVTAPEKITWLLSRLQSVTSVSAHHSFPAETFDVAFTAGGASHHYRVGRDSERADEYWIMLPADGADYTSAREIGRIRSAELAQWLGELFKDGH